MSGGSSDSNAVAYTNLLPTYIPWIQNWAIDYINTASVLAFDNFSPYTGPTYAVQNSDETDGIAAVAARGANGSLIEATGEAYLQPLVAGEFGVNPNLDAAFQKKIDEIMEDFTEDTLPSIDSVFAYAFGGSEHNIEQAKAADKMMNAINKIGETVYYSDYRQERASQDSGIAHAIPYGQRGLRDAEMLRQAGVYAREWQQGQYIDNWNQWNENQILPMRNLDIFGNAVRTILGTQRTETVKYYKPPAFAQIAGAALSGLSLYAMFKGKTLSEYSTGKLDKTLPQPVENNSQLPGDISLGSGGLTQNSPLSQDNALTPNFPLLLGDGS